MSLEHPTQNLCFYMSTVFPVAFTFMSATQQFLTLTSSPIHLQGFMLQCHPISSAPCSFCHFDDSFHAAAAAALHRRCHSTVLSYGLLFLLNKYIGQCLLLTDGGFPGCSISQTPLPAKLSKCNERLLHPICAPSSPFTCIVIITFYAALKLFS